MEDKTSLHGPSSHELESVNIIIIMRIAHTADCWLPVFTLADCWLPVFTLTNALHKWSIELCPSAVAGKHEDRLLKTVKTVFLKLDVAIDAGGRGWWMLQSLRRCLSGLPLLMAAPTSSPSAPAPLSSMAPYSLHQVWPPAVCIKYGPLLSASSMAPLSAANFSKQFGAWAY